MKFLSFKRLQREYAEHQAMLTEHADILNPLRGIYISEEKLSQVISGQLGQPSQTLLVHKPIPPKSGGCGCSRAKRNAGQTPEKNQ